MGLNLNLCHRTLVVKPKLNYASASLNYAMRVTYTAVTAVYRLLKYVKIERALFLVDTRNLGKQAENEFIGYMPNGETHRFSELYGVRRLKSGNIPTSSQLCISTIQRMYSMINNLHADVNIYKKLSHTLYFVLIRKQAIKPAGFTYRDLE